MRHGYRRGRLGCKAIAAGKTRVGHNQECRDRITKELEKSDECLTANEYHVQQVSSRVCTTYGASEMRPLPYPPQLMDRGHACPPSISSLTKEGSQHRCTRGRLSSAPILPVRTSIRGVRTAQDHTWSLTRSLDMGVTTSKNAAPKSMFYKNMQKITPK